MFWEAEEALRVLPKKILRWNCTNRANLFNYGLSIRENVFAFTFKVVFTYALCLCQSDSASVLWYFTFNVMSYIPEVSDETGALLVYSCLITYKSFSHRPTSTEHAELLGMWTRVNPECMFFKNFRGKSFGNGKRYAKSETTIQKALEERNPNHILHVQFERKTSVSQSNLLYP